MYIARHLIKADKLKRHHACRCEAELRGACTSFVRLSYGYVGDATILWRMLDVMLLNTDAICKG